MGQPELSETFDAASIQGMDDIFVEPVAGREQALPDPAVEPVAGRDQVLPDPAVEALAGRDQVPPDPAEALTCPVQVPADDGVSLEEASKVLKLHVDTIKKRLRKGTLKGFKVTEKYGDRWLVSRSEIEGRSIEAVAGRDQAVAGRDQALPDLAVEAVTGRDYVLPDPAVEVRAGHDQAPPNPAPESMTGPIVDVEVDPDAVNASTNDAEYQRLMSIIESQAHQLRAAGDVIVYLKSEVDEAKTQIKLLTDSQHKAGWWARFCSWFTSPKQ